MILSALLFACVVGSCQPVDDTPQTQPAPKKAATSASEDSKLQVDLAIDLAKSGKAVWGQLTPSASYAINDYWTVEGGVPVYVVNGNLSSDGLSHVGIGDVYGDVSLDLSGDETTFYSTFSLAVPTGDVSKGLGFGQVTWDWSNHVERAVGVVMPFADLGFSNSLDLTSRIARRRADGVTGPPPALVGNLFNGEGGIEIGLSDAVSISASGYIDSSLGQQTIVTRPGPKGKALIHTIATSQGDRGVSLELAATLSRALDLSAELWHSGTYHSNTASVGLVLHLAELFKR